MCCFSGPRGRTDALQVSATRIFARADGDRQKLVYSMKLLTHVPVAMVLPIPIPLGTREDAVRFVDLSAYPAFFDAMEDAFKPVERGGFAPMGTDDELSAQLLVHRVGQFVASFAPTFAAMGRLDPRFRLADGVFDSLPEVMTRGFVVFQLDVPLGKDEPIHPMAFDFPRADPSRLFFPTLHVHDGELHAEAEFDHHLYLQAQDVSTLGASWLLAEQNVEWNMNFRDTKGLVVAGMPLAKRVLKGMLPNRDQVVGAG